MLAGQTKVHVSESAAYVYVSVYADTDPWTKVHVSEAGTKVHVSERYIMYMCQCMQRQTSGSQPRNLVHTRGTHVERQTRVVMGSPVPIRCS